MSRNEFSIKGEETYLNGEKFLVKGLRCSNSLISDETADDLINHLDLYADYGVNTISVYIMGSRFGNVKGYKKNGALDHAYAERLESILEAADSRGMVVLVGCLYWGVSTAKWPHWTQNEANDAVRKTVEWLSGNNHRNVFVDVDNEGMALAQAGFDNRELVIAGKYVDSSIMIATNFKGDPPAEADLGIHHSNKVKGKPYIDTEGCMDNAPGGYWTDYSKKEGLLEYLNVGVYSEKMKQRQFEITQDHLHNGRGYMFSSTWLQAAPPQGPNHHPGGNGSLQDPGIRWWLEYLKEHYGSYQAVEISSYTE